MLFLVVYLWAAGGAAWSSLMCPCVVLCGEAPILCHASGSHHHHRHAPAAASAHECTPEGHACASALCGEQSAPVCEAPCCHHLHTIYEALYTRCCDGERCRQHLSYKLLSERLCAAVLLLPEVPVPARFEATPIRGDRSVPPLRRGCPIVAGLRAPPVTA